MIVVLHPLLIYLSVNCSIILATNMKSSREPISDVVADCCADAANTL